MTGVRWNVDAPPEFARNGIKTSGHWIRFEHSAGHAYVHWQGGPKSADRTVLLHHIEVNPKGQGHGTELLRDITLWADHRQFTIKLVCDPLFTSWYGRHRFVRAGEYHGSAEMIRTPGLLVPG